MADTLKRYCNIALGTATTGAAIVTAGAAGALIRNMHFCNIGTAAASVNISLGGSASTTFAGTLSIYNGFSIPANGIHVANVNIYLNASEKMWAYGGTTIIATISGVDL